MFAIKAKQRLHNCIIKTQFILFVKPDKMLDKAAAKSVKNFKKKLDTLCGEMPKEKMQSLPGVQRMRPRTS